MLLNPTAAFDLAASYESQLSSAALQSDKTTFAPKCITSDAHFQSLTHIKLYKLNVKTETERRKQMKRWQLNTTEEDPNIFRQMITVAQEMKFAIISPQTFPRKSLWDPTQAVVRVENALDVDKRKPRAAVNHKTTDGVTDEDWDNISVSYKCSRAVQTVGYQRITRPHW